MFLSNKKLLNILLILNISILSAAYFIEYILKIPPCSMCLYQRTPYYMASFFILLSLFNIINFKNLIIILIILSLINIGLSFYHIGIEQGFFSELSTCKDEINANTTKDLLNQLKSKGVVSCKEVSFTIFGLSLATINFIVNIGLILFYWVIFKNEKK